MTQASDDLKARLIEEVPEAAGIIRGKEDLLAALAESYGAPEEIRSDPIDREVVYKLPEKKLGVIQDGQTAEITGFTVYRGEVPEGFISRQAAPCTNGFVRTSTVTTTSPAVFVTAATIVVSAPLLAALAMANLVTHTGNVRAAKTTACAPCAAPCSCTAVTVAGAGTAGFTYTPVNRVLGVAVSWNVTHVITTQIRATCA